MRLPETRLGRALGEPECTTLLQRLGSLGYDRLLDVRDDRPAEALAVWLMRPEAA
jgi:hypothetical protein